MGQKYTKIFYMIVIAFLFVAFGYYLGDKYGLELFTETEIEKIEKVEKVLEERLKTGTAVTSIGRIKRIDTKDTENPSIIFADQTLASAGGFDQSSIDRRIIIDKNTLLTRQEVEDGPRQPVGLDYLAPGHYVRIWLNKADFESPDVAAKQVVVYQYIGISTDF